MSAEKTTEKLIQALTADQVDNSCLQFSGIYRAQKYLVAYMYKRKTSMCNMAKLLKMFISKPGFNKVVGVMNTRSTLWILSCMYA